MSDQSNGDLEAGYEICIRGHLGARWAAWFDGLEPHRPTRRHHAHLWPGRRPVRAAWPAPEGT